MKSPHSSLGVGQGRRPPHNVQVQGSSTGKDLVGHRLVRDQHLNTVQTYLELASVNKQSCQANVHLTTTQPKLRVDQLFVLSKRPVVDGDGRVSLCSTWDATNDKLRMKN